MIGTDAKLNINFSNREIVEKNGLKLCSSNNDKKMK